MSKNNITGDNLVSKPTEGYQDGYDLIWGNKRTPEQERARHSNYETIELGRVLIKDNEKVEND